MAVTGGMKHPPAPLPPRTAVTIASAHYRPSEPCCVEAVTFVAPDGTVRVDWATAEAHYRTEPRVGFYGTAVTATLPEAGKALADAAILAAGSP